MKNILLFLIISMISNILFSSKSFASSEIDKNLNLSVNTSHLLTFDEKIIRYKFENEKEFQSEILSNIFNSRQELLIKPLQKLDNKLTVWTASRIYNFNIAFEQNKVTNTPKIDEDEIDKPPFLSGMTDFDLDNPPIINK